MLPHRERRRLAAPWASSLDGSAGVGSPHRDFRRLRGALSEVVAVDDDAGAALALVVAPDEPAALEDGFFPESAASMCAM